MQFSSWMGQVSKSSYFASANDVLMTTITKLKPQVVFQCWLPVVSAAPQQTNVRQVLGIYLSQILNYLLNYLLVFRPLLSEAGNRLPWISNNKLKFPLMGFCLPPTLPMTHLASCLTLNRCSCTHCQCTLYTNTHTHKNCCHNESLTKTNFTQE